MRIRTVKPGFFTDPDVVAVGVPARLLLLSMLTQADDEGRMLDQPRLLCANAFGDGDKVNPERLVSELAGGREPRILRYEVSGKRYIQVHGFLKHQVISRPRPSVHPLPPLHDDSVIPPGAVHEASALNGMEVEEEGNGTGMEVIAPLARRDELFESLAEACGIDWHHLTPAARGELNAAAKALREAGDADADEIRYRAEAYRLTYPSVAFTPSALAKHWPSLANGQRRTGPTTTADKLLVRAAQMRREEQGR